MVKLLIPFAVAAGVAGTSALTFDFKDPKGVSGLTVTIDSELEPLSGHANGVSGNVVFDPSNPAASSGTITVEANSLMVGSEAMTAAMRQDWCLDTNRYKTITFKVLKIDRVKGSAAKGWNAMVTGAFSLHGVTKTITVPVQARHLPGAIKLRGGMEGVQGDLLAIRSKFSILRKDYGIAKDLTETVLGNKVDIQLAFMGVCPK